MKWAASFVLVGILICTVFGQQTKDASPAKAQQPGQSGAPAVPAVPHSRFDFDAFTIAKTGLLTLKDRTNEFLLVPQARYPGELRSVMALDFQDQIYVARFGEPGGIGVEGFYDICFQIKGGKVLTHSFELGGSLERVSDKIFVRSSAYIYDRADKTVFKVKYGEPATPAPVAMTNVLGPFLTCE
jgi:hypothetical protein